MNFRRSIIVAELWRPAVARRWKNSFFAFFGKRPPYEGIFQNSVPKGFIATPIDVLWSNFVKFGRREIGEIVRCYKENSPDFPTLATGRIAPKICQTMYSECSRFHPNLFTCGRVIPERVNTIFFKTGRKVFPMFWGSLASSRIITRPYQGRVLFRL